MKLSLCVHVCQHYNTPAGKIIQTVVPPVMVMMDELSSPSSTTPSQRVPQGHVFGPVLFPVIAN